MKQQMSTWVVLSALVAAMPVVAQEATAPKPVNMNDMRHHLYVMEGALARAVDYGAKALNRELLAVMPGLFMLAGEAQAARTPDDETDAQRLFELLPPHRECRRRDVERAGRAAQRAGAGERFHEAQIGQGDHQQVIIQFS